MRGGGGGNDAIAGREEKKSRGALTYCIDAKETCYTGKRDLYTLL